MHIAQQALLPTTEPGQKSEVFGKLIGLTKTNVEPVGRWYEALCLRRQQKQTLSAHSLRSSSSDELTGELSGEDEEDEKFLRTLDPKDWKNQDHYMVLGLGKLRYRASDDKIKRAYKKKVLTHHPDKRKARGLEVKEGDDDYFTCVTRAYEILGTPLKRRSYDSVDPDFDDSIPSVCSESKENFYKVFGPVFERNARWSTTQPVTKLGDENSSFDEFNDFYSFWYDFDSWREYSYLDEEEKEKGENREERRWIEKQNKAARQKRKKEEVARVRQLVDNAYACDPRIAKFKEEEKEKKLAQKKAKQEAARARAEEEKRKLREEKEAAERKKKEEEDAAKAKAAAIRREKDAQRKALRNERKTMRAAIKDFDYFAKGEDERVTHMQEVEKLAEMLSLTSMQEFNQSLLSGDPDKARDAFLQNVQIINEEQEKEKQKQLEALQKSSSGSEGDGSKGKNPWSEIEVQTLIKAVKTFPAGTVQRWETIANFLSQHVEGSKRSAKEVLMKTKDLQKMSDASAQKEDVNKHAFDKFSKSHKAAGAAEKAEASQRFESVAEQQVAETGSNPAPWTVEEQKLLEQSLKTYGANTPDRWDKIAAVLPARSKRDCMKRYKELVEMVKAKKAAAAAAAAKKK